MSQRLLLISPVRNEEAHIELVAEAVAAQTRPPDLWVVVNDNSTDATAEILARLAERIGFLKVLNAADVVPPRSTGPVKDRLATAAEVEDVPRRARQRRLAVLYAHRQARRRHRAPE